MHHSVLIEDLAVVLCVAGIVAILFQKLKQPAVLGYLIAGLIVGPYTPPFSLIDDENEIRLLAELGVIFLMFSLGLEFTFGRLTRLGLPAMIIGTFEVVTMLLIGFWIGEILGWPSYESLLLGAALSISSTTIIVKALEEFNLKRFSFAELIIGVLLIEDLLAILLLVYISTIGGDASLFSNEIAFTSLKLLLVITSWFLIGYFAVPYVMRQIQNYINHETLTIIAIGSCLFLSSVAIYFNYSAALGAFVMGAILAETSLVHKIEALTLPIRDIFAAVFFVSVGMLIDPRIIFSYWHIILILSLVTIVGKLLMCAIGALLAGQTLSDAIKIGFSMAQIGEFSFIIIGLGGSMKMMDGALYPIVVAIAVITTFATPYLIKIGLWLGDNSKSWLPSPWQDRLKSYQEKFAQETVGQKPQTKNFIRFFLNGLIVAMIATVCAHVLIPHLIPAVDYEWPFQFLFWFIISLLLSPFIWAMFFTNKTRKTSLMVIIARLIAATELFLLGWFYLSMPILMLPIGLLLYAHFKLFFHPIKTTYLWMENQLVSNLTRKYEIDPAVLQKIAPWDYELVRIKVTSHSPFIGQTLEESHLRPSFGINIIAIKRGLKTFWLPKAKERIYPADELFVLAGKDEIENFKIYMEKVAEEITTQPEMNIQALQITDKHILNNHPISDPSVKDHIPGLIVGLDRNGEHILNPSPTTILQNGDILLYIAKKE